MPAVVMTFVMATAGSVADERSSCCRRRARSCAETPTGLEWFPLVGVIALIILVIWRINITGFGLSARPGW